MLTGWLWINTNWVDYNNESFVMQSKFIPREKKLNFFWFVIQCEITADEEQKYQEFVIPTMLHSDFIYLFTLPDCYSNRLAGLCKYLRINDSGSEAENPCISHTLSSLATRLEKLFKAWITVLNTTLKIS